MRAQAERDRRHEGGLNFEQFKRLTLESADENGELDPPSLADFWGTMSWLHRLMFDGLIRRRDYLKGGPWVLTEAGRQARAALKETIDK